MKKIIIFVFLINSIFTQQCRFNAQVWSAGWHDGNNFSIKINDKEIETPSKGRGFNFGIFNPYTGKMEDFQHFDTHNGVDQVNKMVTFINGILPGKIVLVGVYDEASKFLDDNGVKALQTIGYPLNFKLGYRDSFALIGAKHNDISLYKHSVFTKGSVTQEMCLSYEIDENCATQIDVVSAGFQDPMNIEFYQNYEKIEFETNRGLNIIKFNLENPSIIDDMQVFDTWGDSQSGSKLIKFLDSFQNGQKIVIGLYDSGENYLSTFSENLKSFGGPSEGVKIGYRESFIFFGQKGWSTDKGFLKQSAIQTGGIATGQCIQKKSNGTCDEEDVADVKSVTEDEPIQDDCVILYSECNFQGSYVEVCDKVPKLQFDTKSVYIPEGKKVTLYNQSCFKGQTAVFKNTVKCLDSLDFNLLKQKGVKLLKNNKKHLKGNKNQNYQAIVSDI